jgi:hypothetical protein
MRLPVRIPRGAFACLCGIIAACGAIDSVGVSASEQAIDVQERRGRRGPKPAADVVIDWSQRAYDIAYAEDQFLTWKGQRALAMVHLAVHDALQSIQPIYAHYAWQTSEPAADPIVATAVAAHDVLVAAYPDQRPMLDEALAKWVGEKSAGKPKMLGQRVGAASARAVIERREGDGYDRPGEYHFRDGPGEYQTTPPWDGFTLLPAFRQARPFSLDDPTRFRPPPPPALDSPEYAKAFDEVRVQGDSTSRVRTTDQTGYAVWWMEFSESAIGRLSRRMLRGRKLGLWDANRALAHLYVALYDGYISNWDSKYEYNHWRPYTSIRAADTDDNPSTEPDRDWVPLRPTPPFPEYASAHATGCATGYEVMAAVFGNETPFENTSLTAPPGMPTRRFPSFRAAAAECADSRIRIGWHYRYATDAGLEAGRRIARHVLETILTPR